MLSVYVSFFFSKGVSMVSATIIFAPASFNMDTMDEMVDFGKSKLINEFPTLFKHGIIVKIAIFDY